MKLLEKCIEFIINNNIKQLIMKDYIKNVDNNEKILKWNMKFKYFELRLHDQIEISEIDKLLKIVD